MKVYADDGQQLDATFRIEVVGGAPTLLFESRGGRQGSPGARNVDYNLGLQLLLERLGLAGAVLDDVLVESRSTTQLAAEERRILVDDHPYPIHLARFADARDLRVALGRGRARVGRQPGATGGGNPNKQIRLYLTLPPHLSPAEVDAVIARSGPLPRHHGLIAKHDTYDILGAAGELDDDVWQLPSGDARPGDRLVFWRTNDREGRRGVAALGEVVAGPASITEPKASRRFWNDSPPEGPVRRIRFRFLPAPRFPVWLGDGHDDLLTSLSVSDAQGNKLYKVTPEQWTRLCALAGVAMLGPEADEDQPAQEDLVDAVERRRARRRGQGFSSNPEFSRAVEMRAMNVARAHYEDDGWTVTDTSANRPYDLVAQKGGDLKYVEVKGTTGDAAAVTIT